MYPFIITTQQGRWLRLAGTVFVSRNRLMTTGFPFLGRTRSLPGLSPRVFLFSAVGPCTVESGLLAPSG